MCPTRRLRYEGTARIGERCWSHLVRRLGDKAVAQDPARLRKEVQIAHLRWAIRRLEAGEIGNRPSQRVLPLDEGINAGRKRFARDVAGFTGIFSHLGMSEGLHQGSS